MLRISHVPAMVQPSAALAADLRTLIGHLKRRLQDRSLIGDLTASQVAVLSRLDRDGPATVTVLARAEGMRPQSMGATIAVLEAAGLVIGTPDPTDGRQTLLSLTPACRERIDASRVARQDWLQRAIEASLSPDEQAELARSVGLLRRLAQS